MNSQTGGCSATPEPGESSDLAEPESRSEPNGTPADGEVRSGEEEPSSQPRRRSGGAWRTAIEWVLLVGGALLVALLIKTFLFQAFWIPSDSMEPTLEPNDRVLVNKLSYRLHDVHRGDIVVFSAPESSGSDIGHLVKRVVGLPGERVSARFGVVRINGEPLDESYLPEGTVTDRFGPTRVPAGAVFVMGDNRSRSKDSREFGSVSVSDVTGRVFVRIWPPTRLSLL